MMSGAAFIRHGMGTMIFQSTSDDYVDEEIADE
jgi:hypothetical protein